MSEIIDALNREIGGIASSFEVCGIINRHGDIYPLGSDTKVLSTVFELICRSVVVSVAKQLDYQVVEPVVQNHYPDFSLVRSVVATDVHHRGPEFALARSRCEKPKIAIDAKTTYRNTKSERFNYTLGGYTSFIRPGNESKNIVFPFSDYVEHYIVGFVYSRTVAKKADPRFVYTADGLDEIPAPIEDIEFFVQEKWRIAGDGAGSGNTTNIGSITGTIDDFRQGAVPSVPRKNSWSIGAATNVPPRGGRTRTPTYRSSVDSDGRGDDIFCILDGGAAALRERTTTSIMGLRNFSVGPT